MWKVGNKSRGFYCGDLRETHNDLIYGGTSGSNCIRIEGGQNAGIILFTCLSKTMV